MTISWVGLLTLMLDGPALEPTVRGVLQSFDGDEPGRHDLGWVVTRGEPAPVFAAADRPATGTPLRVWRDGNRVRIEELDGRPVLIVGAEHCWDFADGSATPVRSAARAVRYR